MSAPSEQTAAAQSRLWRTLGACRRRMAREWLADAARRSACALLGLLLVLVILDHTLAGGIPHVRLMPGLIASALLALTACLCLAIVRKSARITDLFAAWRIEHDAGVRHNSIINGVLLARGAADPDGPIGAAIEQAARDADSAGTARRAVGRGSRRVVTTAALLLCALLAYSLMAPKSVPLSLGRLLGSGAPPPTATRLTLIRPADGTPVYASEPLLIEVGAAGQMPEEISFAWRSSGGTPIEVAEQSGDDTSTWPLRRMMQPIPDAASPARWRVALAASEVVGDFHFVAAGGDATLRGVIRVQPQPAIVAYQITLAPPAYTGLPKSRTSDPDLIAWAGTLATISVRARSALRDPVFVFGAHDADRTWMTIDASDPTRAVVEVPLLASGPYRIEFRDAHGRAPQTPECHTITIRNDAPPTLEWTAPAEPATDSAVDLAKLAELAARAADDLGLREAAFVLSTPDGNTWRQPLALESVGRIADRPGAARHTPGELRESELRIAAHTIPLAVGQQGLGWFEAADQRVLPDGRSSPQTGRSTARKLTRSSPAGKPASQPDATSGPSRGDRDGAADAAPTAEGDKPADDPSGANDTPSGAPSSPDAAADGSAASDGAGQSDSPAEQPGSGKDGQSGQGNAERGKGDRPGPRDESDEASEWESFVSQNAEQIRNLAQQVDRDDDSTRPAPRENPDSNADDSRQGDSQDDKSPPGGDETAPVGASGDDKPQPGNSAGGGDQEQSGAPGREQPDAPDSSGDGPPSDGAGQRPAEGPESPHAQQESDAGNPSDAGKPSEASGDGAAGDAPGTPNRDTPPDPAGAGDSTGGGGAGERTPGSPTGPSPANESADGDSPSSATPAPEADEPGAPPRLGDAALDSAGRAERVDLLELLARQGVLDESQLQELTRSPERREAFTRAVQRLREQGESRPSGGVSRSQHAYRPGDARAQAGKQRASDLALDRARPRGVADDATTISPPSEQNIAPRLRPLLDAYYRAMAETPRAAPPTAP